MASPGSDTDSETDSIETFLTNLLTGDEFNPLLSSLHSFPIDEDDVRGQITHLSLNFLQQSGCPMKLVCPLSAQVSENISAEELAECLGGGKHGGDSSKKEYSIVKLQNLVRKKIFQACQGIPRDSNPQGNDGLRETSAQSGGDEVDNASFSLLSKLKSQPDHLSKLLFSEHAIRNRRQKMEDKHVIVPDLSALFGKKDCPSTMYCGVFDGHVGEEAAVYSATHLHRFIVENENYKDNLKQAIHESFVKTDFVFCSQEQRRSGTTAVITLLRDKKLYIGWLGDSQATLFRNSEAVFTVDSHKPGKESEKKRIEEAGGFISFFGTWRVMGLLAVSRAIGDADYKPYVTADPDVVCLDLDGTEDMVIMGTDGVWDSLSPENAMEVVVAALKKSDVEGPKLAGREVVNRAKALGSVDNITAVVIFLRDLQDIVAGYEKFVEKRKAAAVNATPLIDMNDISSSPGKDSAWPNPLKSVFGTGETGNNGFANNGMGDSSGGSSPFPEQSNLASGMGDGILTANGGSNGHHEVFNGDSDGQDDADHDDDHHLVGLDNHNHHSDELEHEFEHPCEQQVSFLDSESQSQSQSESVPVTTSASGMTYGDLSPEHAGFYPEVSSVEPGYPNMVNLPGDLPEVVEEEEDERKFVEAMVAGQQGHADHVVDRVSPTSEDVHSAISAIDTALLAGHTGLPADEDIGDEPVSDDDWSYTKGANDAPEQANPELVDVGHGNLNPFLENLSDEDMPQYQLNPEARGFIPGMPAHLIIATAPVVDDDQLPGEGNPTPVPEMDDHHEDKHPAVVESPRPETPPEGDVVQKAEAATPEPPPQKEPVFEVEDFVVVEPAEHFGDPVPKPMENAEFHGDFEPIVDADLEHHREDDHVSPPHPEVQHEDHFAEHNHPGDGDHEHEVEAHHDEILHFDEPDEHHNQFDHAPHQEVHEEKHVELEIQHGYEPEPDPSPVPEAPHDDHNEVHLDAHVEHADQDPLGDVPPVHVHQDAHAQVRVETPDGGEIPHEDEIPHGVPPPHYEFQDHGHGVPHELEHGGHHDHGLQLETPSMRHVFSEACASQMVMMEEHIYRSDELEDLRRSNDQGKGFGVFSHGSSEEVAAPANLMETAPPVTEPEPEPEPAPAPVSDLMELPPVHEEIIQPVHQAEVLEAAAVPAPAPEPIHSEVSEAAPAAASLEHVAVPAADLAPRALSPTPEPAPQPEVEPVAEAPAPVVAAEAKPASAKKAKSPAAPGSAPKKAVPSATKKAVGAPAVAATGSASRTKTTAGPSGPKAAAPRAAPRPAPAAGAAGPSKPAAARPGLGEKKPVGAAGAAKAAAPARPTPAARAAAPKAPAAPKPAVGAAPTKTTQTRPATATAGAKPATAVTKTAAPRPAGAPGVSRASPARPTTAPTTRVAPSSAPRPTVPRTTTAAAKPSAPATRPAHPAPRLAAGAAKPTTAAPRTAGAAGAAKPAMGTGAARPGPSKPGTAAPGASRPATGNASALKTTASRTATHAPKTGAAAPAPKAGTAAGGTRPPPIRRPAVKKDETKEKPKEEGGGPSGDQPPAAL